MLYRCFFVVFRIAERQLPKSCEGNDLMNKRTLHRLFSALMALVMAVSLLTGCGTKTAENVEKQEDAQTIQVYLWSTSLYETYAPYIQSQLPDVNIEFIVGNNDLDFYKFLEENGGLPDIITSCRFSLHDAAPLKDSLMNLALTNEAGAVYNTYLNSFKNEDGSVNWLPVCADAHGFVVNRSLFEQYGIPLPTDYESFVSACQAFEKVGIRGFTADYTYDYTCMETLQGLSAAELTTTDGRKWRTAYSDPASTARVGLDDTVWPGAFERMAQFIQDTHLTADDLALNYDDVTGMFRNGEAAMYFGSSAGVKMFQDEGIDTIFLPFFSQNGEKWIMTTPYFQIALNRDLEQDNARREKAMKVLNVMLSEEAQSRIVADGQDLLSYSQNVPLRLTEYMKDVRDVVEENHMYIRIASNDFFAVSKDVVSKMIAGEYTAQQAYRAFNAQLLAEETPADDEIVLTSGKSYSNVFHANGGSASFSVMANTLRGVYGTDVLLATANSFTGSVLQADYNKKMAASMIMPNGLMSRQRTMTGGRAEGDRPRLCGGLRGWVCALQPRLSAGGQRHCRGGQRGKRQLYSDRHHPERTAAPGRRHRYRDLSGSGKSDGSAACERKRQVFGRRYMGKKQMARSSLRRRRSACRA